MNATLEKFGYPDTLLAEYDAWVVLLRPQQATLGALVLACTEPAQAFSAVSREGCTELARVTADIERVLTEQFAYDKINYLMLMMVDPDVHFHVLPRYGTPREFASVAFEDPGWPGPPRLDYATELDAQRFGKLAAQLREAF